MNLCWKRSAVNYWRRRQFCERTLNFDVCELFVSRVRDFRNWLDGACVSVLSLTHELPCVHRSESLRWEKSNEYACPVYFTLYYVYIPMKISRNELFEERTFESLFLFFIYIYRTEGISLDNSEKGLSYKRATLRNVLRLHKFWRSNFTIPSTKWIHFQKIVLKNLKSNVIHFPFSKLIARNNPPKFKESPTKAYPISSIPSSKPVMGKI